VIKDNFAVGLDWQILANKKNFIKEHSGSQGIILQEKNFCAFKEKAQYHNKISLTALLADFQRNLVYITDSFSEKSEDPLYWVCFIENGSIAPTGSNINDSDLQLYMIKKGYKEIYEDIDYSSDMLLTKEELLKIGPFLKEKANMELDFHNIQFFFGLDIHDEELLELFSDEINTEDYADVVKEHIETLTKTRLKEYQLQKLKVDRTLHFIVGALIVGMITWYGYDKISEYRSNNYQEQQRKILIHKQIKVKKQQELEQRLLYIKDIRQRNASEVLYVILDAIDRIPRLTYGWNLKYLDMNAGESIVDQVAEQEKAKRSRTAKDSKKVEVGSNKYLHAQYSRQKYATVAQLPSINKTLGSDSVNISSDANYASFNLPFKLSSEISKSITTTDLADANKKVRKKTMFISQLQQSNIRYLINENDDGVDNSYDSVEKISLSDTGLASLLKLFSMSASNPYFTIIKIKVDFADSGQMSNWNVKGEIYG